MKKQMGLLFTHLSLICVVAFAQPGTAPKQPNPEERIKMVSDKMEKELKLTAAQKEKMSAAFKDFFAAIEKERAKEGNAKNPPPPPPPPPVKKETMEKLSSARDAKIKTVLSESQYKQYVELEKSMRPPRPDGPPKDKKN